MIMAIVRIADIQRISGKITTTGFRCPNKSGLIKVTLLTDTVERTRATSKVSVTVEVSDDGVSGWRRWIGFGFTGNTKTDKLGNPLGNPTVRANIAEVAGKFVRISTDNTESLQLGIELEVPD